MLRTLSCASNQCVAQHADAICGKVASFWSFELLEDFLKRKHFYSSFLLSNKMRIHIRTPCCTFTERVGGVVTGTEKMLPTGSSVTASWLYLSCSTAQHRPKGHNVCAAQGKTEQACVCPLTLPCTVVF